MTGALSNLAASLVGAQHTPPRKVLKEKAEEAAAVRRRTTDGFESELEPTEMAQAAREMKDNTQEDAAEDRREHPAYTREGVRKDGERGPSLDVNA